MDEQERQEEMTARYESVAPELWHPDLGVFRVKRVGDLNIDVMPLLFTAAIVTTPVTTEVFYTDRWCYMTLQSALEQAKRWSGELGTEPDGWHRHPGTGRRREAGAEFVRH